MDAKRITRAFFFGDPLLLVGDDFEQQLLVFRVGMYSFKVLVVFFIVQRFAGLARGTSARPTADVAIEFDIGRVQLGLARL